MAKVAAFYDTSAAALERWKGLSWEEKKRYRVWTATSYEVEELLIPEIEQMLQRGKS